MLDWLFHIRDKLEKRRLDRGADAGLGVFWVMAAVFAALYLALMLWLSSQP